MKKFSSFYLPAIVALLVLATSCKKDDEKSKTELLTAKTWTLTKVEMGGSGIYQDISSDFIEDCEKDNSDKFTTAFIYTSAVGANDCDGDEENITGTWAWKDSEKKLSITSDGSTDDFQLEGLTSNSMKLKQTESGIDLRYTFTGK